MLARRVRLENHAARMTEQRQGAKGKAGYAPAKWRVAKQEYTQRDNLLAERRVFDIDGKLQIQHSARRGQVMHLIKIGGGRNGYPHQRQPNKGQRDDDIPDNWIAGLIGRRTHAWAKRYRGKCARAIGKSPSDT